MEPHSDGFQLKGNVGDAANQCNESNQCCQ
jgi:hypothetical protein